MKTACGTMVIHNGQLIDGTGAAAVPDAVVLIRDGRITYAGPVAQAPEPPADAARLDARGGTIMPGLVEAHYHPTYFNVAELADLDIKYPVEYVTLLAAANARLALECGYTAARSISTSGSRRRLTRTCSPAHGWRPAAVRFAAPPASWTGTPNTSNSAWKG